MIDTALGPRSAGPCFGGWQPSCYLKEDQPLNVTICSKLSLIGVVTFWNHTRIEIAMHFRGETFLTPRSGSVLLSRFNALDGDGAQGRN